MNVLAVSVNEPGYEYEIHALVSAFYPGTEVKVCRLEDTVGSSEGLPDLQVMVEEDAVYFTSMGETSDTIKADLSGVTDPKVRKQLMGRLVYFGLSRLTGKSLPWGTLTGIRPVKLVSSLLSEGLTSEELAEYMHTVYLISDAKLALAERIAKTEKGVIDTLNTENGYSLYLGIPFCPTRCLYCSFTSYPLDKWESSVDLYLDALFREIDFTAELFSGISPDSIYIGGGTPTTLSPERLSRLLGKLHDTLDFRSVKELTVEAGRPDSITEEKLLALKEGKVTRISINPQTMNAKTLQTIGRAHTPEDIVKAFELARRSGFDNINADIILGLPEEGPAEVAHTMDELRKLSPESLTVHSLAVKRSSRLKERLRADEEIPSENTEEIMRIASEGALGMGMEPYYLYRQKNISGNFENTGYAKPGKYGIYNIAIMEEVQSVVALGAGTVTKRVFGDGRIERCDNVKDLQLYLSDIDGMIDRKRRLFEVAANV